MNHDERENSGMGKRNRNRFNMLCDIGDLSALLSGSHDIEGFLQCAVDLVARHLDADVCSIYLYDEVSEDLVLKATVGLNPEAVGRVRMKPGEGLVGSTFLHLRPFREASASKNPVFKYFEETQEERFESFLAVPIQRGIQKIGVLVVQHENPDSFTETDVMALRASAAQLASAIENARLLIDLYKATGKRPATDSLTEEPRFIKGMSASGGYALAPAAVFRKSHVDLLTRPGRWDRTYTVDDFHAALEKTSAQLIDLQNRLTERLPESVSLIFTAHFMILKDSKFINKIVQLIDKGISPPDAVKTIARQYIQIFSASPHAYIREKVSDMEDLAGRIIKNFSSPKTESRARTNGGHIVIAGEIYPSEILKLASEEIQGIVLVKGGVTSHVSILARSLKIPMIIADQSDLLHLPEGTPVLLDASIGNIYIHPSEEVVQHFEKQYRIQKAAAVLPKPIAPETRTRDGIRIHLMANVNLLSELETTRNLNAEGIGLYRTEFPFLIRPAFPSEEEQYMIYKRIFDEMEKRPVTIRTLDIGGDKALVYANTTSGLNPDLGLRSIRFSLRHRNIFEQQIRAVLRSAAADDNLRIMFPMISSIDEFQEARKMVQMCMADLEREQLPCHRSPAIGMMVEVPAVVPLIDAFAREADFFSIGTNDFVQYTLAVDRTNEKVSDYYCPEHPAVLRGLHQIVRAAVSAGKDVSVCGEMAHEPEFIPFLIGIGVRTLSIDPQFLPAVQERIAALKFSDAQQHAELLLAEITLRGVRQILSRQDGLTLV